MRRTIDGSRAIITGASSGIGRALAEELSRGGAKLVLVARREQRLAELASQIRTTGRLAEVVVGDITDPATRQTALDRARSVFGGLDILVNNAGVGAVGPFHEVSPDRLRRIMELNFFAAAEMIRESVPLLREGVHPIVVNVSSILGHRAIPHNSEYCASKFALQGLSESLRAEFVPLGIDLLVVSPGSTESEFSESVLERKSRPIWAVQPHVPAATVARRTVRAIRQGRHEIMPNFRATMLWCANRIAPSVVDWAMARYG
ncbi:MAG: SDR family NAD(P)-dependent oxidoreductase [Pirellulales bacterium]